MEMHRAKLGPMLTIKEKSVPSHWLPRLRFGNQGERQPSRAHVPPEMSDSCAPVRADEPWQPDFLVDGENSVKGALLQRTVAPFDRCRHEKIGRAALNKGERGSAA